MGVTYEYVNHDLQQKFDAGLGLSSDKWSGVGRGPGARALGILLSRTWGNCRIGLVGDSSDEWELIAAYDDVTVDIAVMLLEADGTGWLDLKDPQDLQFAGDIAIHLKLTSFAAQLDVHQKNWRQLYAKLPPNSFTVEVLQATGRSLIRF